MEGWCIECGDSRYEEDKFMFHVYCYNVQPGVLIDYMTGDSTFSEIGLGGEKQTWVLNTSSKKFHDPDCSNADSISEKNRDTVNCTREELIYKGYEPCGKCSPE
jgi:DNA-entry nuclease